MVEIRDVYKHFGTVPAVDGVSLSIKTGELLCLLGPSGCGKTTLLRILSGFVTPTKGTVIMDDRDVTYLPPERRPTSLVFQNYALFPHMNVFENIAFGLKVKKLPLSQIREEVSKMLGLVGLSGMETRSIRQLSGGQQQRIALARALIMKPTVLLLDEPLSNLDAKLRVETRLQIRKIQQQVGITSVFVTHDQEEALSISDRIAIMNKGKIMQIGTPEAIYSQPESHFVADFIGKSNFLQGTYKPAENEAHPQPGDAASFVLKNGTSVRCLSADIPAGQARLLLRPEHLSISAESSGNSSCNAIEAVVETVTFLGEVVYCHVRTGSDELLIVPLYGAQAIHNTWTRGDSVTVTWEYTSGRVLDS
jgi:spermidine/putrescine ABC transporter ATP-binding subunit